MPEDTTTTTSTTSTTSTITTTRPCDACYNGCVQIVSDQCVRYTGLDSIPLDIQSGDNLQTVLDNIINSLVPLLTGEGDSIVILESIRCAILNGYLPTPSEADTWTSAQLFNALVKVVCDLQAQIDAIDAEIAILNADYTIDCLTGVTASSDTHAIVQAIITRLCDTIADLAALELDVATNYVKLSDLDALIAAYLASQAGGGGTQEYLKMVPYVAYEYYGPLSNFDGSGVGIPNLGFYKVYLCNGLNATPDKRGRVAVGAIANVPPINIGLDAAVDPNFVGNPNYALFTTAGANSVVLLASQMPTHNHTGIGTTTVTLNDPGHSHFGGKTNDFGGASGSIGLSKNLPQNYATTTSATGITITSNAPGNVAIGIDNTGGGGSHANIQPVIAAYYIMYIP
jgi:microcystin-dependent protein